MRARFVTLNVMAAALVGAAWHWGLFDPMPALAKRELWMLGALVAYWLIGFGAAIAGRWKTAAHIANGAPMWALGCTGLGMILAVGGIRGAVSPEMAGQLFRDVVLAIAPNVLGVVLMAWLRELAYWCGDVEV